MNIQIPTSSTFYYKDLSTIDMNLQKYAPFSPSPPMPIQKRSHLPLKPFVAIESVKVAPIVKGQKTKVECSISNGCICERSEGVVLCQRCGFELKGRIQQTCPSHPKKICLMDHRECPNKFCRSIQLIEVSLNE